MKGKITKRIITKSNSIIFNEIAAIPDAEKLLSIHFMSEGLDRTNWTVSDIPIADNSGKYPVAVLIDALNHREQQLISIFLTQDGDVICVNPGGSTVISCNTISEAIKHPASKLT